MADYRNIFATLPPSRRLIEAARAAGVTGSKAEITAWAKESGWLYGRKDT